MLRLGDTYAWAAGSKELGLEVAILCLKEATQVTVELTDHQQP